MSHHHIVLVLGGCRSGKSSYALAHAESFFGERNLFIATCVPNDPEMKARVARHQAERDAAWSAVEVPVDLAETIGKESRRCNVILIDCLTLWMSNLFGRTNRQEDIDAYVARLTDALDTATCPVILVSNEVGGGIVPDNALARSYRDAVGWMNQAVAKVAERVVLTVAGIPIDIKK